jgi:hypothetical protein
MAAKKKAKGKKAAAKARASRRTGSASRGSAGKVSAKRAKAAKSAKAAKKAKASSTKKTSPKRVPAKKKGAVKKAAVKKAAVKKARPQTLNHPVFGRVTVDPGAGIYWKKMLRLADHDVAVDMTIEDPAEATPELLDRAALLVARLSHFDALARAGLRHSYDEDPDSAVALYVTHHLEELSAETLAAIFDKAKDAVTVEDVLSRLLLRRVGSYPAKAGGSATLDYTIVADESQYVLAVQLDETGDVIAIEMES